MKYSVKLKILNVGKNTVPLCISPKLHLFQEKGKILLGKSFFSYSFLERKSGRLMEHALLNDESE